MRRERITTCVAVLAAALSVLAVAPGTARAATPQQICQDLADGTLNGHYSAADLAAYQQALQNDPTIEGYCSPLPVVPTTPTPSCTVVAPNTPGAVEASNGVWYANAPGGNASACYHAQASTVTVTTGGVKGASKTSGVKGASKTKAAPARASTTTPTPPAPTHVAAPLGATHTSQSLPFTGAQLSVFVIVGLALVAGGLLLRLTGRGKRSNG